MRGLAAFVMRGRGQAILVVATMAVLSFLVPPLSWLSAAALALVTLRKGPGEGSVVMAGALVGAGVLATLTVGSPWPAASFLGVMWLPTWLMAVTLRVTVSLAAALECAALIGLLFVIVIHLAVGDPAAWWQEQLQAVLLQLLSGSDQRQLDLLREAVVRLSGFMTGLMVAAGVLNLWLGLLFGRAWQAGLYNPQGFQREFHALTLHRPAAAAAALLLAASAATGIGPGLVTDLALVLAVPCAVAGLAAAHAVVKARGGRVGWLVALYALLVMALPQVAIALALVGVANAWLDLSRRFAGTAPPPDTGAGQ